MAQHYGTNRNGKKNCLVLDAYILACIHVSQFPFWDGALFIIFSFTTTSAQMFSGDLSVSSLLRSYKLVLSQIHVDL